MLTGSFFRTMLGTKSGHEVRVSRAFAACFAQSKAFRQAIVVLLHGTCGAHLFNADGDWTCDVEIALPSGDRPDLQLTCTSDPRCPVFQLESKVSAVLTQDQMNRYRRYQGDKYLIAITKSPPQTGIRWLREHGCIALRWQDVHRALRKLQRLRGSDKFLVNAFCDYLEDFGMAHREDITENDLLQLQRLFRSISATGSSAISPKNAFDTASSTLSLLMTCTEKLLMVTPCYRNGLDGDRRISGG